MMDRSASSRRLRGALSCLLLRNGADSPDERYGALKRNIVFFMVVVSVIPLLLMAGLNHHLYKTTLRQEMVNPLRVLTGKTRHSFELFLRERLAAVSFIAASHSYEELADRQVLLRTNHALQQEFQGFVDLGLINDNGMQVNYAGPYSLLGKDYSEQDWFHEVRVRGTYVSDVFMGYRNFPHVALAVERRTPQGRRWILRATMNTDKFAALIASMELEPDSDAFLVNHAGVLQTGSRHYGAILEQCALPVPPPSQAAKVYQTKDHQGREVLVSYVYFLNPEYILMVVRPAVDSFRFWNTLRTELAFIFLAGVLAILFVACRLTGYLVQRLRESDRTREAAFREVEHAHKLSSIGRLAAGVAHEVNNPLAIINEKAGLMKDILDMEVGFPARDKFVRLTDSVLQSVNRCRVITHRLLGFARRVDVVVEELDLNEIIREVLGFLEKEALHRNVHLQLDLDPELPRISSDRGQLQQVFLNILNNAFAAVERGGEISIDSWAVDEQTVSVNVGDNGCGMSEETLKHIFEPFFTTKGERGTGLGLSITYGIVRKLGGRITVWSEKGKGSVFTVYLPRENRQQNPEDQE